MPEDDERTESEDLFEDLDKFFAPIQDVDWPEPSKSPDAPPERPKEPEREPAANEEEPTEPAEAGRGSTMAFESQPQLLEKLGIKARKAQSARRTTSSTARSAVAFVVEASTPTHDSDQPAAYSGNGVAPVGSR